MFDPRPDESSADVCPSKYGGPEDAAGPELPLGGNAERLSLLGFYRRILLGNACAAVKSAEILMGGLRVYNAAAFAVALTAFEDAFALHRARQSCHSTLALLAVERDHALHLAREAVRRTGLMARIARDVGEEAAYPLHVRIDLILENLRRRVFL